jgi:hypothetical protein
MKILVVENDKEFSEAWVKLLWKYDYEVRALDNLRDETPQGIHDRSYDLALIDRRVRDDGDKYDTSGEEFALSLCELGTPTALVTSYPPNDIKLFDMLRTGALTGLAHKDIVSMLELVYCINEFRRSHRFPNCMAKFYKKDEAEVMGEADWQKFAEEIKGVEVSGIELSVLFRSLIPPCAQSVVLDPMTPGFGGAALFRAWVSSGDGPVVEEVAVKYGRRAPIMSEAMRYDRHVGPLPDGVAAHLRWRKETQKLAAISYSWVGDSIEDALPFGPIRDESLTWRRRQNALERLFSVSLNPWYRVYRSRASALEPPLKLLSYYTSPDGYGERVPFQGKDFPESLPSKVGSDGNLWDFGQYGKLPNPILWLTEGPGSKLDMHCYSPCHGDLHVKNIFVLPDDSPRLIDFGDTALGHVFRDFAALEVSVRLSCGTRPKALNVPDLDKLVHAAEAASGTRTLGEHINHRLIPKTLPDLRRTLVMTMQIRRAALDAVSNHTGSSTMKEYLFALIIRLLRYANGIADEVSRDEGARETNIRLWHALYCAARATRQAISLEIAVGAK